MVVTGYDDRDGSGYVLCTGSDTETAPPGTEAVSHDGVVVMATPELAAMLRDALAHRPTALLTWSGPRVPLALDDATMLAWLSHDVGGVLTVRGGPEQAG